MAITHKRQDDLETLFANFAIFPEETLKSLESDKEAEQKNDKEQP